MTKELVFKKAFGHTKNMTEIRFYHLQKQPLDTVLPIIVSKAYEKGHRILIRCADPQSVKTMDKHLWTFHPDTFLPHATDKDSDFEDQPIVITSADQNLNKADVVFLTQGTQWPDDDNVALYCDLFDGNDPEAVSQARERWKKTQDSDHKATYWQQSDQGRWEQKA